MKKVLILSGLKIFPNVTGGHLRSGSVAKSLARLGNEVCIYSIAGRKDDYGHGQAMLYQAIEENLVEEVNLSYSFGFVQAFSRRLGLPRFWQYILLSLGLIPLSLKNRLQWADIIICDLPYTPPIPGRFRKKTWLLLSHNLEHRLLAQGTRTERFLAGWMKRLEATVPLRYNGVLACAREDAEFFRARSVDPEQVRLVANGIDPDLYTRSQEAGEAIRKDFGLTPDDHLIVFSGSRFQPNLEALGRLEDFCARESEWLASRRIRFLILGSISPEAKVEGALLKTGPVAETFPYFAAADAALNPVRIGSGSNVKIFEYLAAKLPVVSTSFGARGTTLVPERDYLCFDSDVELKQALENIVSGKSKAEWKEHAASVWDRVQESCDMTAILRKEWKGLKLQSPEAPASRLTLVNGMNSR